MSPKERDEMRQKIDEEIAGLVERIHTLKSSRNALAPINSVPPEVLSRIFHFVRNIHLAETEAIKNYLKWLPITHVSEHWRQVAINDASLWTHLPLYKQSVRILQLFLVRSKACPLSVSLRLPTTIHSSFRLALQSISRIQQLHLVTPAENWNQIVPGLCLPAPELKELKLTDLVYPIRRSQRYPTLSWPQNLFGENAPLLRQLSLTGIPFLGYRPAFHYLTHFILDEPPIRTPVAVLLDALRQMPNLIGLTVKDSAFNEHQEILESDMDISNLALPVVMHHLEQLTIEAPSLQKSLLLFSSLQFTTSPALSFRCVLVKSDIVPSSFPRLLETLKMTYQNGITPFTALELGSDGVEFRLDGHASPTHPFSLSLLARDNVNLLDHFIDWYTECDELPLDNVESVELYGANDSTIFVYFDDREHLKSFSGESGTGTRLVEYIVQNFECHLEEKDSPTTDDEENEDEISYVDPCGEGEKWEDIGFPALEVIKLTSCQYRAHDHPYFVSTLKARKRHGYGPTKIILDDCSGVTEQMLKDLQSVVEVECRETDWDAELF